MRIGQGFDVHALQEGGTLILGGVEIAHSHSLIAHSDGDVLLHALCDALLGAASLGDIGRHFPDSDDAFRGADSRELLRKVMAQLDTRGLTVSSADLTLVAQEPKLAPHVDNMRDAIAQDLHVDAARINVKATTTEHLGFTGRKEGIAAFAVVLLDE